MGNYFLIYMKSPKKESGYKKWPVLLYKYEDETYILLKSLKEISTWLISNKKIYFLNYREKTNYGTLLKSQILTIMGAISIPPAESLGIQDVYTLNEAAKVWGLADGGTIRKALERGKFSNEEAKKSESTWLVTISGMMRLFGPPDEEVYDRLVVNKISYDSTSDKFKIEKMI